MFCAFAHTTRKEENLPDAAAIPGKRDPAGMKINIREGLQRMLTDRQSTYEVVVNQPSVGDLTAEDNQLHATLTFSLTAR